MESPTYQTVVEENAQGISSATENVSDLANSITNIRQQATENVDSSKHLMEEMNRFQKISGSDSGKDGKHEKKNCVSCRCNQF